MSNMSDRKVCVMQDTGNGKTAVAHQRCRDTLPEVSNMTRTGCGHNGSAVVLLGSIFSPLLTEVSSP